MQEQLPRQWDIATAFLLGGILICPPLFFVWRLIISWAGWGDGATGDAIEYSSTTWAVFFVPLPLYFLIGFIASIATKRLDRMILAWVAHLCLLLVLINGMSAFLAIFVYGLIAALFAVCWERILRMSKMQNKAEKPTADRL